MSTVIDLPAHWAIERAGVSFSVGMIPHSDTHAFINVYLNRRFIEEFVFNINYMSSKLYEANAKWESIAEHFTTIKD